MSGPEILAPEDAEEITRGTVCAADIRAMLKARHPAPEWALFFEVPPSTGMDKRKMDAFAMNLWTSRGLVTHGYEIKVSRGDWLREKKDPAKAEPLVACVDSWWIAAPPGVVNDFELPPGWGLLEVRGSRLVTKAHATQRETHPSRAFVAAVLRRAAEMDVNEKALAEEYGRGRASAEEDAKSRDRSAINQAVQRHAELARDVAAFEAASGIKIDKWNAGNIGEAVKLVLRVRRRGFDGLGELAGRARELAGQMDALVTEADKVLAAEIFDVKQDTE